MILQQRIHVVDAVKTPVQHQLALGESQGVEIGQQMLDGFGVRYVACQLPVIKRQSGRFTVHQGQIQLWKVIVFFVLSVLNLPEAFGITGDGSDVVDPIFFFYPSLPLQLKEFLPALFSYGGEQIAASLGGEGVSIRMFMQSRPLLKTVERATIFQNQVVRDRQNLSPGIRERLFQVLRDPQLFPQGIQKIGGAIEETSGFFRGYGTPFWRSELFFLPVSSIGGNDLACLLIHPPDEGSFRPRLFLLLVPMGYRFIGIGDSGPLVFLVDHRCHSLFLLVRYSLSHNDEDCNPYREIIKRYRRFRDFSKTGSLGVRGNTG